MQPDPIFDHCGDDEAEQRWEDMLDEFDNAANALINGGSGLPPTMRQLYAMRVSWLETERHMKLRKSVKQQWNAQNPPQEEDAIMNAGRKTEDPSIKDAGLSGVAEAAVDPRLMPDPEMVRQFQAQFVEPVAYERSVADAADMAEAQMPNPYVRGNGIEHRPPALREGASIYDMHDDIEAHGLGRFKQGMPTPEPVAQRLVGRTRYIHDGTRDDAVSVTMSPTGMHVIVDGVEYVRRDVAQREETVEEHLIRIGVTYKHRTAAKTGRVWLNVPADTLARAEGRPYTKEKKK